MSVKVSDVARANITDIMTMLGDAASAAPPETLSLYLNQAYTLVVAEGTPESNSQFFILHIYKTAHLLHTNGFLKGVINSEAVADVSVSYGNAADKYMSRWDMLYQQTKANVQGLTSRVL